MHHLKPVDIGEKHFLARLMLLYNIYWEIFNKQVPQATA